MSTPDKLRRAREIALFARNPEDVAEALQSIADITPQYEREYLNAPKQQTTTITHRYLSKQHIRAAAKAFPNTNTFYTERNDGLRVYGKLTIGRADVELRCERGGEVAMRLEFLRILDEAYEGVSEMVTDVQNSR